MNYIDLTAEDEKKPLILQRADPYVYYHTDGYYYFTASSPEYDRIELRRAWSIKALADAEPLVIWRKHATGQMSYHIWAPELHFVDGKWYIYFAAGRAEDHWWIRIRLHDLDLSWIYRCLNGRKTWLSRWYGRRIYRNTL